MSISTTEIDQDSNPLIITEFVLTRLQRMLECSKEISSVHTASWTGQSHQSVGIAALTIFMAEGDESVTKDCPASAKNKLLHSQLFDASIPSSESVSSIVSLMGWLSLAGSSLLLYVAHLLHTNCNRR